MAYSHSRLRKTLACVRLLTGVLFVVLGAYKVSSLEYAKNDFPLLLWKVTHGAAVGFYGDFLNSFVWDYPGKIAVMLGFTEPFIGVGLLLGLAVRPVSLFGMLYTANLMLATWMAPGANQPLWRYFDNAEKLIALFFLFLLFGVGHAGENWGLGALYHHRRHRKWEESQEGAAPQESTAETENYYLREFDPDDPFGGDWREAAARKFQTHTEL
jgi:uncharacterized membrane protein YphA (DoxX/SURF4 family)